MRARRIPERWLRWIWAFCSQRSASLSLNGRESEVEALPFPGLPQGSPLSPVLFLFYNADLVERRISNKEGSIAFVDDYTAWVVGKSAESNLSGIKEVVNHALAWERRSGATFEGEKTSLVHFTRNIKKQSTTPIIIEGVDVVPKDEMKVLGVTLDSALQFNNHIKNASSKGLKAQCFAFQPLKYTEEHCSGRWFLLYINMRLYKRRKSPFRPISIRCLAMN